MAYESGEGVNPGNPLDQGNDSHSVETAAADFSAMLQDEGKAPRRERERKPAAQSPEAEAPDDAAEPESGQSERQPRGERQPAESDDDRDDILDAAPEGDDQDDPDDQDDDQDDQDADDADDDQDGDDPLDAEHEIKVNGEVRKVTVRDALAGYMMEADYRQGTERNAREYEEIQGFASETVEARQRATNLLQDVETFLQVLQPSAEDWNTMKDGDPKAFIAAQEHWNGLLGKFRELSTARNGLVSDQENQTKAERNRYLANQERELLIKLPALRDEKRATAFRSSIMDYGRKAGYSDQELIDGAVDHRDLITLYKAARYDQIQASKTAAGKAAANKGPKNSADGQVRAPARSNNGKARRSADRKLRNTGSVKDAADSFTAMILSE